MKKNNKCIRQDREGRRISVTYKMLQNAFGDPFKAMRPIPIIEITTKDETKNSP